MFNSSTTITSCCSMVMHGPMLQGSVYNSGKLKTSQFLHGQHSHQTCHPLSNHCLGYSGYDTYQCIRVPANIQQLCTAIGFVTPPDSPNKAKLHISEWPFIVASLRHTCAIFMLSNQHLDMPHLLGGMDYLDK